MADVIIYEHANFQGRSQVLPKGRYDDAAHQLSFGNDMISSLKVPQGLVARLYEYYHFQGWFTDIKEDTPVISQFWNDRISSIIVYGEAEQPPITKEVMIFEHANYGGKSQILQKGKYDTAQITIGNDALSSALVPTGMVLRLYEYANFQGAFIDIGGDTLAVSMDWNDRASSIVVDEAMPSITSWMRLEPRSRDAEMNTSLQARIYDPLWLLARQWQLGEFQGEDNGSPVMARWRAEAARPTRYHSGAIPDTGVNAPSYDGSRMPLETLVERETIRPATDPTAKPEKLRLAAEAGQQFLRMLNQQPLSRDYRGAFIRQYPFPALTTEQRAALDSDSLSFFDLMASRVPDGRRLYAAFRPTSPGGIVIAPALQIAPDDLAEVEQTARLWLQWFETLFSEPEAVDPSWLPERMEYAFSIGTRFSDGERVLTAQEYFEGHLDWYAFDANAKVTALGAATDNAFTEITRTVIPAPASFRGMPAARFWEFEDAQVDFGSVDAGPTDLARMLLVEFALAYGNDWFVIPIEVDVGSLYRTRSLVITDTFGTRTLIKPNSESGLPHSLWRMFQLSYLRGSGSTAPASNLFFLPPSLLKSLENRPIEEVLFLRDEMANLAWAVERLVESPADRPLNRFEAYLEQKRRREQESPPQPATTPETLRYRLATEIPDYWVPLLPVRTEQGLRLERGAVLKTDGSPEPVHALGRILESGHELSLFEEEVPREGVRVTRGYQFTRWIDGSSHFWVGRRKGVGRGEGSSGLRFDSLDGKD